VKVCKSKVSVLVLTFDTLTNHKKSMHHSMHHRQSHFASYRDFIATLAAVKDTDYLSIENKGSSTVWQSQGGNGHYN
jgi:hypothetical protein